MRFTRRRLQAIVMADWSAQFYMCCSVLSMISEQARLSSDALHQPPSAGSSASIWIAAMLSRGMR